MSSGHDVNGMFEANSNAPLPPEQRITAIDDEETNTNNPSLSRDWTDLNGQRESIGPLRRMWKRCTTGNA